MNRSGIVMEVRNNRAYIMTSRGEFIRIKCKGPNPEIGQIYTGKKAIEIPFYKYSLIAASILLMMFIGNLAYAYNTPTASIMVKINPNIELKINRWDKIIRTIPLNRDGESVLSSLRLRNKSLNNGLSLIVIEAEKKNFINENYIKSGKEIIISVKDKKDDRAVDLSEFVSYAAKNNLTVKIISGNSTKINNKSNNKDAGSMSRPTDNAGSSEIKPQNPVKQRENNVKPNSNDNYKIKHPKTNLDEGNGRNDTKKLQHPINVPGSKKTEREDSEDQKYEKGDNGKDFNTNNGSRYNEEDEGDHDSDND